MRIVWLRLPLLRSFSTIFTGAFMLCSAAGSELAEIEYFEKQVRPLLVAKCQMCHNTQLKSGNIDLSSVEGFVNARDEAALISSTDPASSRLLAIIGYQTKVKMPPGGKLPEHEIQIFKGWIQKGAPWPGAEQWSALIPEEQATFTEEQKQYWAFQPISTPDVPQSEKSGWAHNSVDHFVLAKLQEKGLEPAQPADKLTLLRRATYDLTGLPPTYQEIQDFLADGAQDAFEKVVNRLLSSSAYGERWGRHWLDVARYADSTGNDEDHRYPYAWRYRDYVIKAFNDDLPYDQFVREQIAGDLLPASKQGQINEQGIVATGFLALGPKAVAQQDKKRMLYDVYDEQIEVVSKAMLGLTVACARCHDHKFDPILTRDYYSMAGMFASTRSFKDPSTHVSKLLFKPLVPEMEYKKYQAELTLIRNKQIELDNIADIEIELFIDSIANKTAEYMLASHDVNEKNQEIGQLTKQKGLDPALLTKWATYLKPVTPPRKQLDAWRFAMDKNRNEIALSYQQNFEKTLQEWHFSIRRWRKNAISMLKEGSMPPPPRPVFEAGKDRFFYDIYMAKEAPLRFSKKEKKRILKPETQETIAVLTQDLEQMKAVAMPEPPMANAVEEGEPVVQKVFIRGDYNAEGEDAPKVFPAILEGLNQKPANSVSGRLELASWIASEKNPLTARVMVNRIWQKHFSEGIVRTPSNFGKLGTPPSHPELLDWLASRFITGNWSIKNMHRTIMLSNTYQMSSKTSDLAAMEDPRNLWLSHFHCRRLDVEEIRDSMLAIDNSIDLAMGGTMQSGFGTDRENSNDRLSIDPSTSNRRMVYLPLRRANLPTLLNLFDFGDAVTSTSKRSTTNVAPQALFLMNSKFVSDRARNLAQQLLAEESWTDAERMNQAYLRVLTRQPRAEELDTALTYVDSFDSRFDQVTELDAWQSYCRILLASNDFMYID